MISNLKEIRKSLGKTQTEMALKVGVSLMAYQLWERGVSTPSEENMPKLESAIKEMREEENA